MIIGITGTNGSGKGTVVEFLVERGFIHLSARACITEEIERRGLSVDRSTLRAVANDLRKNQGPAFVIQSLMNDARARGGDVVIESVRALAEASLLKEQGAVIVAIDADKRLRYDRILARGSATDHVSFEEFCEQEDREMNAPEAWDMNVFGVMKMADHTLTNNGSLEELRTAVDAALANLRK